MEYPSIVRDILLDDRFDVKIADMHNWWLFLYNPPFVDVMLDFLNSGTQTGNFCHEYLCTHLNLDDEVAFVILEKYTKNFLRINFHEKEIIAMRKGEGMIFFNMTIDDLYDVVKSYGGYVYAKFYSNSNRSIQYILEAR